SPHVAMTVLPGAASVAIDDARQHAEHLEQEIGACKSSIARGIVGRRHLHEVASDEVEAAAAADDLQRLRRGEAADLRRAGAGRIGGIEAVDVEAEIDRPAPHLLAYLGHERRQRLVPALLGLDDAEALAARPVEIVGSVAGGAQTDLHAALAVEQALLH